MYAVTEHMFSGLNALLWNVPDALLTGFSLAVEVEGQGKQEEKQQDGRPDCAPNDYAHRDNIWAKEWVKMPYKCLMIFPSKADI